MVANATLMDNHQTELAEELATRGHCRWCVPEGVLDAIEGLEGMGAGFSSRRRRGACSFPTHERRCYFNRCVRARAGAVC